MIKGTSDFNLKEFNTFGLESIARSFYRIDEQDQLKNLLNNSDDLPPFILGGGSNVLLPDFLDRAVAKLEFKEWELIEDQKSFSVIRLGSGWNWHEFVLRALGEGIGGIENLSLIPGTVGAAPIQNIGAYGVEIQDFIHAVEFFSFEDKKVHYFYPEDCKFDYRSSIFKYELSGQGAITHVVLRLPKQGQYKLNTSYQSLSVLAEQCKEVSAQKISQWVIEIRQRKLPSPKKLGNAGSFFKNPIISNVEFEKLKNRFKDIPSYQLPDELVKVPAAWLIDYCGWKGKRSGDVGSYMKQPLVIVNFGGAKASDLINWAKSIQEDVQNNFGILLEPEVNILDTHGLRVSI